jgi:hypothetical protein
MPEFPQFEALLLRLNLDKGLRPLPEQGQTVDDFVKEELSKHPGLTLDALAATEYFQWMVSQKASKTFAEDFVQRERTDPDSVINPPVEKKSIRIDPETEEMKAPLPKEHATEGFIYGNRAPTGAKVCTSQLPDLFEVVLTPQQHDYYFQVRPEFLMGSWKNETERQMVFLNWLLLIYETFTKIPYDLKRVEFSYLNDGKYLDTDVIGLPMVKLVSTLNEKSGLLEHYQAVPLKSNAAATEYTGVAFLHTMTREIYDLLRPIAVQRVIDPSILKGWLETLDTSTSTLLPAIVNPTYDKFYLWPISGAFYDLVDGVQDLRPMILSETAVMLENYASGSVVANQVLLSTLMTLLNVELTVVSSKSAIVNTLTRANPVKSYEKYLCTILLSRWYTPRTSVDPDRFDAVATMDAIVSRLLFKECQLEPEQILRIDNMIALNFLCHMGKVPSAVVADLNNRSMYMDVLPEALTYFGPQFAFDYFRTWADAGRDCPRVANYPPFDLRSLRHESQWGSSNNVSRDEPVLPQVQNFIAMVASLDSAKWDSVHRTSLSAMQKILSRVATTSVLDMMLKTINYELRVFSANILTYETYRGDKREMAIRGPDAYCFLPKLLAKLGARYKLTRSAMLFGIGDLTATLLSLKPDSLGIFPYKSDIALGPWAALVEFQRSCELSAAAELYLTAPLYGEPEKMKFVIQHSTGFGKRIMEALEPCGVTSVPIAGTLPFQEALRQLSRIDLRYFGQYPRLVLNGKMARVNDAVFTQACGIEGAERLDYPTYVQRVKDGSMYDLMMRDQTIVVSVRCRVYETFVDGKKSYDWHLDERVFNTESYDILPIHSTTVCIDVVYDPRIRPDFIAGIVAKPASIPIDDSVFSVLRLDTLSNLQTRVVGYKNWNWIQDFPRAAIK